MDSKWPFFVAKNKYGSIPGKEEKKNQKRKEAGRTGETKRKNLVMDIWKLF